MDWQTISAWVHTPWFTVGETHITLARVAGLFFILGFAWWASSMLEKGLRSVALRGRHQAPSSTVYAFTRLVRYVVWIVGTLIGLTYLGFNLASLAFLGGAIGLGIGFGLQNIVSNFIFRQPFSAFRAVHVRALPAINPGCASRALPARASSPSAL